MPRTESVQRASLLRKAAVAAALIAAVGYLLFYVNWLVWAVRMHFKWSRDIDYTLAESLHATPILLVSMGFFFLAFKLRTATKVRGVICWIAAIGWAIVCLGFQDYTRPWLNNFIDVQVVETQVFELPP